MCNGLLYAGQESVTYIVPVTSYIPIQIGREEKHLISFICCYLSILPHPRYSWIFFALIKTEEQWWDSEKAELHHHKAKAFASQIANILLLSSPKNLKKHCVILLLCCVFLILHPYLRYSRSYVYYLNLMCKSSFQQPYYSVLKSVYFKQIKWVLDGYGRICIYAFESYVYMWGGIVQASPLVDSTRLFVIQTEIWPLLLTSTFLFLKTVNFYILHSFTSGNYNSLEIQLRISNSSLSLNICQSILRS